jgi:putative PIN family toxin of toxin-antitoxin system
MSIAKAGKLRVVLDSNVYVSAFTRRPGSPFLIWRAALDRHYVLLVSPTLVDELGGILRVRFDWPDEQITRRLKLLTKVAEIVNPDLTIDAIPADDDDNRILECAIAGKADLIVSGDRHLRTSGRSGTSALSALSISVAPWAMCPPREANQ